MKLNLRAAVLHVNSAAANAVSPTMRIARFVAEELGVPLVHDLTTARDRLGRGKDKPVDVLFVKHGILKFSNHRDEALELYQRAKVIVNLQNDFTFKADNRFNREKEAIVWSTCEGQDAYCNWNCLTWLPPAWWAAAKPFAQDLRQRVLYYGAFRSGDPRDHYKYGRMPSFIRYFENPTYPLTISSFRGGPKFAELTGDSGDIEIMGAFKDKATPAQYAVVPYIEDEYSHTMFTSPANRFYECLQLGVAQAFDYATVGTMRDAGFDVKPFVVRDAHDLKRTLKSGWYEKARKAQRKAWHRDFSVELRAALRSAAIKQFGRAALVK